MNMPADQQGNKENLKKIQDKIHTGATMTHKTTKNFPGLVLVIIMLVAGFLAISDNAWAQDELDKPLTDQPVTEEPGEMEQPGSLFETTSGRQTLMRGGDLMPFMLPIIFIFVVMGIAAFSLIWRALFPRRAEWTREIAQRMPVGSLFFGLGAFIVTFILIAIFSNAGEGAEILAVLILAAFLLLLGTFKITAMVGWAGDVLDPASTGIKHALYGASALMLLLVIPFLGWLVLFGLACIGVGAALMSYIPARRVTEANSVGGAIQNESTRSDPIEK